MTDELRITRGDDRTFDIDVSDLDDSGPVDLTTFEGVWFTAKRRVSDADADAIIRKALGADLAIDGTIHSRAVVNVLAADTEALADRVVRLVWDVQVRDDAGRIVTVASGTLAVYPDVTRAPREVVVPVVLPPLPDVDGYVLTIVGGIPVWAPAAAAGAIGQLHDTIDASDFVLGPGGLAYIKTMTDAYPSGAVPVGFLFQITTAFVSTDGIGGPAGTAPKLLLFADPSGAGQAMMASAVPADAIAELVEYPNPPAGGSVVGLHPTVIFSDAASVLAFPTVGEVEVYALYAEIEAES